MENTQPNVLVVDDNPDILKVVSMALELNGYHCQTAIDGSKAIAILENNSFDLVITDIFMPEKDGIELIMYLKKEWPTMKIIAISAGDEMSQNITGDRYEFLNSANLLGAESILKKPFEIDALIEIVNQHISH